MIARPGAEEVPSARSRVRPASLWAWALVAVAVAVQLVVLYAPSGAGEGPFPHSDKVVHVLVFLAPVTAALLAGAARWLVVAVFGAHAVVSEVVQAVLLPARAGDVLDVLADLAGIGLGVGLWWLLARVRRPVGRMSGRW